MLSHPRRRSLRLKDYDYSQPGAYFVTIVTQNRACLFGEMHEGEMRLNPAGEMVWKWWEELPHKFEHVDLDEAVVMPNHFHGVIVTVGATLRGRPWYGTVSSTPAEPGQPHRVAPTLGEIVGWFKTMTTNEYIRNVKQNNWPPFQGTLWQRNYYEHIIRSEKDLDPIRQYIVNNQYQWEEDPENPAYSKL